MQQRRSGILLHPTSLPGNHGIGDIGPELYRFIDYLHKNGQTLWQILPLGPTGYGNSPYQCFSAFAGNPLLISPQILIQMDLLTKHDSTPPKFSNKSRIEYESVIAYKQKIIEIAYRNYTQKADPTLEAELNNFIDAHGYWLNEFALFMSLKKANNMKSWIEWETSFKKREPYTIAKWIENNTYDIELFKFSQFLFFKQWEMAKNYAKQRNVKIVGDIPIFVAYDSADVWSNPDLYFLDDEGELLFVAGVPPDYFSETGQRWGNPLYRWDEMKKNGYEWWVKRIEHNLEQVDILRIDHFRGFESFWQISAEEETAVEGKWIKGPGIEFFKELNKELGKLPIIAEDLGVITPEVEKLLKETGFPGMNVVQFAFGDDNDKYTENKYLPHNVVQNSIVYTGTHDNQTTLAWFNNLSAELRKQVLEYTESSEKDIVGDLIKLAWGSAANMAVIPLQDLLRLGIEARMNTPGTTGNNWEWRYSWNQEMERRGKEIFKLTTLYER
ncbi:4-alpha-glucanotransferase [Candidatus Heimdallarchaeota archaeon B3_Heim]|nr:MAG: 4-alpha-glucanotransferase [Candidatus Heimdallarchaeota archaeon B3_Heim]